MVQVGVLALGVVKNAIVEVWLPSETRNPFTWTIVVVDHRKHFFVAGSEFCYGHESILAEGWHHECNPDFAYNHGLE